MWNKIRCIETIIQNQRPDPSPGQEFDFSVDPNGILLNLTFRLWLDQKFRAILGYRNQINFISIAYSIFWSRINFDFLRTKFKFVLQTGVKSKITCKYSKLAESWRALVKIWIVLKISKWVWVSFEEFWKS